MKSCYLKIILVTIFFVQTMFLCYASDKEPRVFRKGNEIIIENLELLSKYGQENYEYTHLKTWNKADLLIYKSIKNVSYDYLWVVVIPCTEDKYGKYEQERPITIGKVDVKEGKKYVDYEHWIRQFQGTYRMWIKDLSDFKSRYEKEAIKQYKGKKYDFLDLSKEARNYWFQIHENALDLQRDYYRPKSIR